MQVDWDSFKTLSDGCSHPQETQNPLSVLLPTHIIISHYDNLITQFSGIHCQPLILLVSLHAHVHSLLLIQAGPLLV